MNPVIDFSRFAPRTTKILIVCAACVLAPLLGYYFTRFGFQTRELAILGLGVVALVLVLVPSDRVLQIGFGVWVLTFSLGWRNLYLTQILSIHPSEVIAWTLFALVIVRSVLQRTSLDWRIPFWIPLLLAFCIMGVGISMAVGREFDVVVSEFKAIFSILPVYYIIKWLVLSPKVWERTANLTIVVGVYLGCLGMLDILAPGLSSQLAGGTQGYVTLGSVQGFERALFTIFGAPLAGAVILTLLGFTLRQLFRPNVSLRTRLVFVGAFLIQMVGIYLSGYRATILGSLVLLAFYVLFERRAWVLVLGAIAVIPLLPITFVRRLLSLVDSQYADSSQVRRIGRAEQALELVWNSPVWGNGWGASGYVHSDLVQIAGNLGIPALLVFLGWFGATMHGLWKLCRQSGFFREYAAALLATMVGVLVVLAGEGIIVFIQLMIPVWFLLCMAHRLIELANSEGRAPAVTQTTL